MVNQNKLNPKLHHEQISKIHLKIARKIQWREQVVFQLISKEEIQMWPLQYQISEFQVKRSSLIDLHKPQVWNKNQDVSKLLIKIKISFWDNPTVNLGLSKRNLKKIRLTVESIHHGGVKACFNHHLEIRNKSKNQQAKIDLVLKPHLKEEWEK